MHLFCQASGWMWVRFNNAYFDVESFIGQPRDFLRGMKLYLSHVSKCPKLSAQLATGENIIGPVLVDKTAKIGSGGLIGPNVVIGPNVRLEDGVRIMDSTVLSNTVVQTHSYIKDSIIGWKCNIG
jgi:mannose-1-phosphate guanylyltransferase